MKSKTILSLFFALAISVVSLAQSKDLPPAEDRARRLTEHMQQALDLSNEQVEQVFAIHLEAALRVDKTLLKLTGEEKTEMLRQIQTDRHEQLRAIFTDDEMKKAEKIIDAQLQQWKH